MFTRVLQEGTEFDRTLELPASVRNRIAGGEPATKAVREWRGISQIELADRTSLAITQIMRAERGGEVSKPVLRLMARGLRVLDCVFIPSEPKSEISHATADPRSPA